MKRDTMHVNTKGKRRRNRNFNESWNTDLPGASKNGSNIESNVDTQGFSGFVRTRSSYRQACIENMGMCRSPEQNSSVASHGNYGDATIHNNIAASNTMNYSEDRATCDGYKENMCFIGGDEVLSSHLGGRNRGKSGCRMLQDITNVAVNLQSKCDVAATSEGRVLRRSSYRLARMQNQGSITNTSGSIDAVMLGSGETQPNQLSAYSGKQELYKQIRFEFNKETYSDDDSSLAGVEEPEGCDVDEDAVFGNQPVSTVNPYASALGEKVANETLLGQPLFSICCMKGKIQLPKLSSPPEPLWSMYFDKKNESYKNFRENIRSYNNMFSFTSRGGKIDHGLNAGHGPYTFVLSGTNYHRIGNLVPPVDQPPVYGYGGTGKTFLWNALAATLRAKGDIVLTVASSGIAATLLPSGRTAHSRFAIPIQVTEDSVCAISQGSPLANLIICTKLIIWDEAPMVHRFCVESFDRSLRDIIHSSRPFGGKCIVMGGDFRQILPVIPKGSRAAVVDACISSSQLWKYCTVFTLTRNMRLGLNSDAQSQVALRDFAQWLLDVGDGKLGLPHDGEAEIDILPQLLVSGYGDPIDAIVQETYPDLLGNMMNNQYFNDRAILAPTIEAVDRVNEFMCSKLFGEAVEYLSCDSICQSCQDNDSFESLHTTAYLNTINCSGLPSHSMLLKVGCPIMLLRNIDQANGLCNGTRLVITQLGNAVIEAITLNGSHPNQRVLIHRMDMNPSNSSMPFKMKRRQFPISLSFAMTINKSQGQSLHYVGLYLSKPVFTHGQLYVALSRVRSMDGLKIVLGDGHQINGRRTMNVVYREIFGNIIDANASIGAPFVV